MQLLSFRKQLFRIKCRTRSLILNQPELAIPLAWVIVMIVVAAIGGYVIMSAILLWYPNIIHKKKNVRFRATHISHRGGAGENLENTITAFSHAKSLGTDMFELDCHITRDGEVVVCHDESLLRTTGRDGTVMETLYKDLPLLKESLNLDFRKNHIIKGTEDRSIPLLKDVFEKFPKIPINIDVKVDNDDMIKKFVVKTLTTPDIVHSISDLVVEYNRESITVWGSRSYDVINKCHKQNPNIPLFFCLKKVFHLLLLFYTGLLPFVPLRETFYEIVMPSVVLSKENIGADFSRKQRFIIHALDCLIMNRALIRHLNRRGIQTYVWVLNDEDDFDRAFKYGFSGIMTDFPSKLTKYLTERPHLWKRTGQ